jgi:hypothetical protein
MTASIGTAFVYRTPVGAPLLSVTPIAVATDGERLRIGRACMPRARGIPRRPPHAVVPQLDGFVTKDHPATIGVIIPTAIDQIRGTAMIIGAWVALDPRWYSLDVLGVIVVDHFAPGMREAPRQYRR